MAGVFAKDGGLVINCRHVRARTVRSPWVFQKVVAQVSSQIWGVCATLSFPRILGNPRGSGVGCGRRDAGVSGREPESGLPAPQPRAPAPTLRRLSGERGVGGGAGWGSAELKARWDHLGGALSTHLPGSR